MKMKVGDILKKEIHNTPGLQYPYKIEINKNFIYPEQQKLENEIFIENCNTFLNDFHINKQIIMRHRSYSQKKKSNQSSIKKFFIKKNTQNFSKNTITQKLLDILPSLGDNSPKTERQILSNNNNSNHINPTLFNESLAIKNKIKNLKKVKNNKTNYSVSNTKKEIIPNIKEAKVCNQIRVDNFFNTQRKNKANSINKKTRNIFEIRIKNKMKIMNKIINKLDTPIFLYNKTEVN